MPYNPYFSLCALFFFTIPFLQGSEIDPKSSTPIFSFGENFYTTKLPTSSKSLQRSNITQQKTTPPSSQENRQQRKRNFTTYHQGQLVSNYPYPNLNLLPIRVELLTFPPKRQKRAKICCPPKCPTTLPLPQLLTPPKKKVPSPSQFFATSLYQLFISFLSQQKKSDEPPSFQDACRSALAFHKLLEQKKIFPAKLFSGTSNQEKELAQERFRDRNTYLFRSWKSLSFLTCFRKHSANGQLDRAVGSTLHQLGKKELLTRWLVCSCFPDSWLLPYLHQLNQELYNELLLFLLFLNRTCILPQIGQRSMRLLSPFSFLQSMQASIAATPIRSGMPSYLLLKELTLHSPIKLEKRVPILIEIISKGWPFLLQEGSFPIASQPFSTQQQERLLKFFKREQLDTPPLSALFRFSIYLQQLLTRCPLLLRDRKIVRELRKAKLFFLRRSVHSRSLSAESKRLASAWRDQKQLLLSDHQYKLEERLSYLHDATLISYKLAEEMLSTNSIPYRYSYTGLLLRNSYQFSFAYESCLAQAILQGVDLRTQLVRINQEGWTEKIKPNLFFELLHFYNLELFEHLFFSKLTYKKGPFPSLLLKELLLHLMNLWSRWLERQQLKLLSVKTKLGRLQVGEKKREKFLIQLVKKILNDRQQDLQVPALLAPQSGKKRGDKNYPLLNLAMLCTTKPLILSKLLTTFSRFTHPIVPKTPSTGHKGDKKGAQPVTLLGQNRWVTQGSRVALILVKHQLLHLFDTQNLLWQEMIFSLNNRRDNRERYSKQLLHYFLWFCYHAKQTKTDYQQALAAVSLLLNKKWLFDSPLQLIPAIEGIINHYLLPAHPFPAAPNQRKKLLLALSHCRQTIITLYQRELDRHPVIDKTLNQLNLSIQQNSYELIPMQLLRQSITHWPIGSKNFRLSLASYPTNL